MVCVLHCINLQMHISVTAKTIFAATAYEKEQIKYSKEFQYVDNVQKKFEDTIAFMDTQGAISDID